MDTLVSIDDGRILWDNLEYARIQVRIRKSSSASLSKNLRINGKLYHVRIVEEITSQGGDLCNASVFVMLLQIVCPQEILLSKKPSSPGGRATKGKAMEESGCGRRSHARGTVRISLRKRKKGVYLRNVFLAMGMECRRKVSFLPQTK